MTRVPTIVIGASRSGEGKTTLALGLVAALRARGLTVGACKVGPDYLDAGHLTLAAGRPARNLDLWMCGEAGVREAFGKAAADADAVVVEGVMGLHDGRADGSPSSTVDVAHALGAPVLLALDASGASASLGAIGSGLAGFDPRVRVLGAVLGRFRTGRVRDPVARAFERAEIPVLGWLPPDPRAALPSRHLGLILAEEDRERTSAAIAAAAEIVEAHVDLDAVLAATGPGVRIDDAVDDRAPRAADPVRIGVARDEAFAFYYADNLEALEAAGGAIVPFSPLRDAAPPADLDGLYLGGGYPELHAETLERNATMRAAVRAAVLGGLPTFAECGGMLYLGESLTGGDGRPRDMAGALPIRARMGERLAAVGYRETELLADCPLGRAGQTLRGHEFRYSHVERTGEAPAGVTLQGRADGAATPTLFASYLHVHFAGNPRLARRFVETCRSARAERPPEPARCERRPA